MQAYVNQGTATSTQTGPVPTDGNGDPVDGNQPTRFEAVGAGGTAQPVLDAQKRWSLAVDTPPTGLPSPGDAIEYTIFVSNTGSATATNVRLTDLGPTCTGALTPCTVYVPGSLTTSQGAMVSTAPIVVNLGNLPPGANATVSFRVVVDAATADGVVVANQATITANGHAPVLTDDNGVPGDGRNPTLTPITRGSTVGPPGEPRDLTKQAAGSSEPDGISSGNRAVIGEVVRYRVSVAMPKGTLRQVTLADVLPAGLAYLPGSAPSRTRSTPGSSPRRIPAGSTAPPRVPLSPSPTAPGSSSAAASEGSDDARGVPRGRRDGLRRRHHGARDLHARIPRSRAQYSQAIRLARRWSTPRRSASGTRLGNRSR